MMVLQMRLLLEVWEEKGICEGVRKMTPREWARLQGFPDTFKIVVADASAYKQFGNSVAIPAIQATAENELRMLNII